MNRGWGAVIKLRNRLFSGRTTRLYIRMHTRINTRKFPTSGDTQKLSFFLWHKKHAFNTYRELKSKSTICSVHPFHFHAYSSFFPFFSPFDRESDRERKGLTPFRLRKRIQSTQSYSHKGNVSVRACVRALFRSTTCSSRKKERQIDSSLSTPIVFFSPWKKRDMMIIFPSRFLLSWKKICSSVGESEKNNFLSPPFLVRSHTQCNPLMGPSNLMPDVLGTLLVYGTDEKEKRGLSQDESRKKVFFFHFVFALRKKASYHCSDFMIKKRNDCTVVVLQWRTFPLLVLKCPTFFLAQCTYPGP